MILNPIAIATKGVYANNINLGLASKGYIDLFLFIIPDFDIVVRSRDLETIVANNESLDLCVLSQNLNIILDSQIMFDIIVPNQSDLLDIIIRK